MLKIIAWILLVLLLLVVIYLVLGQYGLVPLYHCDSAMGPGGAVHWCEWYSGGKRVY